MRIEVVPLAMNIAITGYYVWQWQEPGRIIYWCGATLITVGLLFMKG